MGVVASAALGQPRHEVKVAGRVEGDRVAIEDVNDQCQVAVGSELVGDQLAVLPDADDVGDEQDAGILVCLVGLGSGQVGGVLADLDVLTGGCASASSIISQIPCSLPHSIALGSGCRDEAAGRPKLQESGGK